MVAPACRTEQIAQLISTVDRYNPNNCHLLEDYLNEQLANNTYDLIANLALLKLYQFNPSLLSPSASLSSLLLSVSHAPFSPDFSLCWSLLSDSFAVGASLPPPPPTSDSDSQASEPDTPAPAGERETAEHLLALSTLLRARKFKAFWSALRDPKVDGPFAKQVSEGVGRLVSSAEGFEKTIRNEIGREVEASFVSIKRNTLESFLGLQPNSSELESFVSQSGWTLNGSTVSIGKNESNSPASSVQREKIEIDQLSKLLGRSQA